MFVPSLIFILSLLILLVSARFFTGSAERLGLHFGMSSFVIGVFIVGIGTSLPELVAGVLAGVAGKSEIVSGNVLGANIADIFLILGLIAVLSRRGLELGPEYIMVDLNFLIGSSLLLSLVMMDGGIAFSEGIFLLAAYAIYGLFLLRSGRPPLLETDGTNLPIKTVFPVKALLILLASGFGIYFGADFTVESMIEIANHLNVPPSLIALTVLSLGTTLPELAVNITAIRQGKSAIAVGNILGSCVFNALVIPGAVSGIGPIHVPKYLISFSLPVFAVGSLLFYLLTQQRIRPSTVYSMVERKEIPHYKVGRLIRFKKSEIDQWMAERKEEVTDTRVEAKKVFRYIAKKANLDVNRIVKKAIDGAKGRGYNSAYGKPDHFKGLGKEVEDGTL